MSKSLDLTVDVKNRVTDLNQRHMSADTCTGHIPRSRDSSLAGKRDVTVRGICICCLCAKAVLWVSLIKSSMMQTNAENRCFVRPPKNLWTESEHQHESCEASMVVRAWYDHVYKAASARFADWHSQCGSCSKRTSIVAQFLCNL